MSLASNESFSKCIALARARSYLRSKAQLSLRNIYRPALCPLAAPVAPNCAFAVFKTEHRQATWHLCPNALHTRLHAHGCCPSMLDDTPE